MPLDSTAIPPRFSPDIALVNIVIVRQCNGRTLTHQIPERPAPKINFSQVVEHRQVNGTSMNSIPAHVLVDLVTRKKENVRVHDPNIFHQLGIGESGGLVPGESGHHDFLLVNRVLPDHTLEIPFLG